MKGPLIGLVLVALFLYVAWPLISALAGVLVGLYKFGAVL